MPKIGKGKDYWTVTDVANKYGLRRETIISWIILYANSGCPFPKPVIFVKTKRGRITKLYSRKYVQNWLKNPMKLIEDIEDE